MIHEYGHGGNIFQIKLGSSQYFPNQVGFKSILKI